MLLPFYRDGHESTLAWFHSNLGAIDGCALASGLAHEALSTLAVTSLLGQDLVLPCLSPLHHKSKTIRDLANNPLCKEAWLTGVPLGFGLDSGARPQNTEFVFLCLLIASSQGPTKSPLNPDFCDKFGRRPFNVFLLFLLGCLCCVAVAAFEFSCKICKQTSKNSCF